RRSAKPASRKVRARTCEDREGIRISKRVAPSARKQVTCGEAPYIGTNRTRFEGSVSAGWSPAPPLQSRHSSTFAARWRMGSLEGGNFEKSGRGWPFRCVGPGTSFEAAAVEQSVALPGNAAIRDDGADKPGGTCPPSPRGAPRLPRRSVDRNRTACARGARPSAAKRTGWRRDGCRRCRADAHPLLSAASRKAR